MYAAVLGSGSGACEQNNLKVSFSNSGFHCVSWTEQLFPPSSAPKTQRTPHSTPGSVDGASGEKPKLAEKVLCNLDSSVKQSTT